MDEGTHFPSITLTPAAPTLSQERAKEYRIRPCEERSDAAIFSSASIVPASTPRTGCDRRSHGDIGRLRRDAVLGQSPAQSLFFYGLHLNNEMADRRATLEKKTQGQERLAIPYGHDVTRDYT